LQDFSAHHAETLQCFNTKINTNHNKKASLFNF